MIHYDVHPETPQLRLLTHAVRILKHDDGICVYPTDTVYGMGACVSNAKAVARIARILRKDKKRLFSFICSDFSQMSEYVRIGNAQYKLMKRYLPGPYTFVLPATHFVPKKISPRRKTVGVRMPDCPVVVELVRMLGEPLANTSIRLPGRSRGDPDSVRPAVFNEVDIMLDTGVLPDPTGSTIVDLTGDIPEVVRRGKGAWEE